MTVTAPLIPPAPMVLILPGLYNSGPGHWQTLWERQLPAARRLEQRDWEQPRRAEWVGRLDAAVQASPVPLLLAAHSLGCATTAWWAALHGHERHAAKVVGALLVAPPDVERPQAPAGVRDFAPMPRLRLPFASIVVAASDDPWCALPRARAWAEDWGAHWRDIGARGHINADSGLGAWPEGQALLEELRCAARPL